MSKTPDNEPIPGGVTVLLQRTAELEHQIATLKTMLEQLTMTVWRVLERLDRYERDPRD